MSLSWFTRPPLLQCQNLQQNYTICDAYLVSKSTTSTQGSSSSGLKPGIIYPKSDGREKDCQIHVTFFTTPRISTCTTSRHDSIPSFKPFIRMRFSNRGF